jgi:hypothetical protein
VDVRIPNRPAGTNPGSPEALFLGCTCPELANNWGQGHRGDTVFCVEACCPMHGFLKEEKREE